MKTTPQTLLDAEAGVAQKLPRREGEYLDMTTAHAILTVYRDLSPINQAKLLAMPFLKMADVCWKLLDRCQTHASSPTP